MKTFIIVLMAGIGLAGCSSHEESRHSSRAASGTGGYDDTVGPASAATDPVSGARVRTDAAWRTHWHGNWYFFESQDNLRRFQSDPTAYVGEDGRMKRDYRPVTPSDVR